MGRLDSKMGKEVSNSLEALSRENLVLGQRVGELERRLQRFALEDTSATPLGAALSEREALLQEAERIAHMGSWIWDVESAEVRWSDELYRIPGCDPDSDSASTAAFFERVHPEDRQRVQETASNGIATAAVNRSTIGCFALTAAFAT